MAFTPAEIAVVDRIAGWPPEAAQRTVSRYLVKVARYRRRGSAGLGQGGGLYFTPGVFANADGTFILANDASTSDEDVFGILV